MRSPLFLALVARVGPSSPWRPALSPCPGPPVRPAFLPLRGGAQLLCGFLCLRPSAVSPPAAVAARARSLVPPSGGGVAAGRSRPPAFVRPDVPPGPTGFSAPRPRCSPAPFHAPRCRLCGLLPGNLCRRPRAPLSPPARVARSGQGAGKRLVGKGEGIGRPLSRPRCPCSLPLPFALSRADGRAYSPSRSLSSPARPSPPPPARWRRAPALVAQKAKQGAAPRRPFPRADGRAFSPSRSLSSPACPSLPPLAHWRQGQGRGGQRKRPLFPFGKKKSYKTTKIS